MPQRPFVNLMSFRRTKWRRGKILQVKIRPLPETEVLAATQRGQCVVVASLQALSETFLRFVPIFGKGRFAPADTVSLCFSPLHEGDAFVASLRTTSGPLRGVSVPFKRGTPSLLFREPGSAECRFRFSPLHEGDAFVALTAHGAELGTHWFQSPSRGGRLRCTSWITAQGRCYRCFSPLHEGDAFVANRAKFEALNSPKFQSPSRGGRLRCSEVSSCERHKLHRFSPLHEGDAFVAPRNAGAAGEQVEVSVPFTRGTPSLPAAPIPRPASSKVSVPFTRGTPSLLCADGVAAAVSAFQSPSRGGRLRC